MFARGRLRQLYRKRFARQGWRANNVRPYGVSIVLRLPQNQLSVPIRIHGQGVPCRVGAADDFLRDHRFHMGLDVPLQGAGAVDRVIAAVDDGVLGPRR